MNLIKRIDARLLTEGLFGSRPKPQPDLVQQLEQLKKRLADLHKKDEELRRQFKQSHSLAEKQHATRLIAQVEQEIRHTLRLGKMIQLQATKAGVAPAEEDELRQELEKGGGNVDYTKGMSPEELAMMKELEGNG